MDVWGGRRVPSTLKIASRAPAVPSSPLFFSLVLFLLPLQWSLVAFPQILTQLPLLGVICHVLATTIVYLYWRNRYFVGRSSLDLAIHGKCTRDTRDTSHAHSFAGGCRGIRRLSWGLFFFFPSLVCIESEGLGLRSDVARCADFVWAVPQCVTEMRLFRRPGLPLGFKLSPCSLSQPLNPASCPWPSWRLFICIPLRAGNSTICLLNQG